MTKAKRSAPLGETIEKLVNTLFNGMFGIYRPELHYMRGPGPKWREKHLPAHESVEAMPAHQTKAAA